MPGSDGTMPALRVIDGGSMPSPPFSDAEDRLISRLYESFGADRVAAIIGRRPQEVEAYARFWGYDSGSGVIVYDGGLHGE